ncbi:MAG: hypothetical protein WBA76_16020 [Phormidesmis sp.]
MPADEWLTIPQHLRGTDDDSIFFWGMAIAGPQPDFSLFTTGVGVVHHRVTLSCWDQVVQRSDRT